ncbi:MAG: hypothetical protein ABIQ73_26610 [Acidimicrobiales bacterium]
MAYAGPIAFPPLINSVHVVTRFVSQMWSTAADVGQGHHSAIEGGRADGELQWAWAMLLRVLAAI